MIAAKRGSLKIAELLFSRRDKKGNFTEEMPELEGTDTNKARKEFLWELRCEALRGKGQCVTDDAAAAGHFRHAKQLLESSSCPLEMELRFKICLDLAGCLYREDQFKECGDACEEILAGGSSQSSLDLGRM
ncbi:MAG: hypothetical protein WDW36_007159 [Sanguina aurantia]